MRIGILKTNVNLNDSFEDKMRSLGENTGNMVFWHSLKRLLKTENIPYNYREIGFDVSVYDAIVCTDLIWIREESNFNYLNKILDDIKVPLIPISVGLQASSYNKNFKLSDDTVKLLKRIQERAVIGVRGKYTAEILEKYGIHNFSIIGCPSMYYWNNPDLKIVNNASTLKNFLVNFRTIYGCLNKHEKHFLSYAADKNAAFIEQTRHVLCPENTKDEKYFSYVSKWMKKNRKMYFCVEDWMGSTCRNDFSMGARFHGNVISLWNNMKSLFITVDSRTSELTEYFNLPSIPMSEFDPSKSIEYYYEKADYSLFNQTYKEKFNNFVNFLECNGLCIDNDVEPLQFCQSSTEKLEYANSTSNIQNIKIKTTDFVDDVLAYKKSGKDMKIILYGDTQLNRWRYRPQLKRMDIDIYAYYIPNSNITKLDGIKVINKDDLMTLDETLFILVSTESALASVEIAEISTLSLTDAYVYTKFTSKLSMIINDKFRIIDKENYSKSFPWYFELVYDNISSSERHEFIEGFPFLKNAIAKNNYLSFADYSSKYLNIVNGARLTTDIPNIKSKNCVYFFGDSRIYGDGVPDKDTIESNLQRILNEQYESLGYEVVNYGVPSSTPHELFLHLKNIVLQKDDIVIFSTDTDLSSKMEVALSLYERCQLFVEPLIEANEYCVSSNASFYFFELGNINCIEKPSAVEMFIKDAFDIKNEMLHSRMKFVNTVEKIAVANNIAYFNISYIYNRPHSYGEIFYDPYHFGPKGNKLIANEIFNIISLRLPFTIGKHNRIKKISSKFYNQIVEDLHKRQQNRELDKYIAMLCTYSKGLTLESKDGGVIVMNCNLFTFGHRYLIETASKQVKHLYILVVEENKSEFDFNDRFEMVKRGVADIGNVTVLPSGKFVISTVTLPEYFQKSELQEATIDASTDVELFATKIAPALGAKIRFVGEEPFCAVTNQYNETMQRILPEYDIELRIIARRETGGVPISATNVRKHLKAGDMDKVKQLVPETTYNYLLDMYNNPNK